MVADIRAGQKKQGKAIYFLIFHRTLLEDNPDGIILSTDDYFCKNGQYHYDPDCLGEAHDWNRKRGEK